MGPDGIALPGYSCCGQLGLCVFSSTAATFFFWSGVIELQNPLHTIRTRLPALLLELFRVSDAVSDFAATATMVGHAWLLPHRTTES